MKKEFVDTYYLAHEEEMDDSVFLRMDFVKRHEEIDEKCKQIFELLEPLGKNAWTVMDQLLVLYNQDESECCRAMYIKGFLDYERLVQGYDLEMCYTGDRNKRVSGGVGTGRIDELLEELIEETEGLW